MSARIIPGGRGGKVLINQGFKYQKNRVRRETVHWRCWREECRVPLKTNLFDVDDPDARIEIEGNLPQHTHAAEDEMIAKSVIKSALNESVREDPSIPIKRVYDSIVRTVHQGGGDRDCIPQFHNVRSAMTRARQEHVPNIPHSVDEVRIEGTWNETWSGDEYLLHQDNDWGILIFSTEEDLTNLRKCQDIYMDGTFRTCPAPYKQYFSVHGKFRNRVLLFCSCLMTSKTIGQYRQVLQTLKTRVRQITGHRWRPVRVVCDFEQALIGAIHTELPLVQVNGCYFHFTQALWRKVQSLGLTTNYRQNDNLRKCIRKVMSVGYLPLLLVRQNFNTLRQSRRTRRLVRRFPALADFLRYFQMNFLDGNFPPMMWNVFDRDMDTRSNNHVESKLNIYSHIYNT